MIKDGMETKAVVRTMMMRSRIVFLRRAAPAPSTTPKISARKAAMTPSLALVLRPSPMMSMTMRPLCFSEGPKRKWMTSLR